MYKETLINKDKGGFIIGFIITILGLLLKSYMYNINPSLYSDNKEQLSTIIYVTGLFILLSNIGLLFKQNTIINYIADKTYGIYLIHFLIVKKFTTTNLYRRLNFKVLNFSFIEQFLLELLYTLIIFVICLTITIIIKKLIYLKILFIKKKHRN